jgi:hypothetical protein
MTAPIFGGGYVGVVTREPAPSRRLSLSGLECHELAVLLMREIQRASTAGEDPDRVRRLRALLDRLTS